VELVEGVAEDVRWHLNLVPLLLLLLLLMMKTAGFGGLEEMFQNVLCRGGLFYVQPQEKLLAKVLCI
jgi:hypothetical protein